MPLTTDDAPSGSPSGGPSDAQSDEVSGVVSAAHRGAAAPAPEHTLAALDQAVAAGADRISVDVQLTKDGVPILMHDPSMERTTDVADRFPDAHPSYRPQDFTLEQVRTLDAGSWYPGGTYTGSAVLTLEEVLTELEDSPVGLYIEPKPEGTATVEGIGSAVMELVAKHPAWMPDPTARTPRLLVESLPSPTSRWSFLEAMHDAYPDLPLVLLSRKVTPEDVEAHPYVHEVDVRHNYLTPDVVEAAHSRGIRVNVWLLNSRSAIRRFLDSGADGIVSDRPALVRDVLAGAGMTWSGTASPAPAKVARVRLRIPGSVRADDRLPVEALLRDADDRPVRWRGVQFQQLLDGRWTTLAGNATDSHGSARVSLPVAAGMRLRALADGRVSPVHGPTVLR
jgi:glycerophosphoryl diester phosphodiesterase